MKKEVPISSSFIKNLCAETIKLGVDAHLNRYVVVIKVDSSAPMRARRFASEELLLSFVGELQGKCRQLYCCYEAGPFGYGLHRRLESMGVINYVIRPINWDEHGKRVKTDNRDATEMALALDGYLRGNRRSFSVIRVPSEQEERLRSVSRQRESLMKQRKRLGAQGCGIAVYYGGHLKWGWWKARSWKRLGDELDDYLWELLEPVQALLLVVEDELAKVLERLEAMQQPALPKGMATILFQGMEREVCDWGRFNNRKQVGSFTGLCPCEDTSALRRFQGSINKHGNPRLRRLLIEAVWLLWKFNPTYCRFQRWPQKTDTKKLSKARLKKLVVATARQFAVDWWRLRTGRISAEELGLVMKPIS
jgi:transposase